MLDDLKGEAEEIAKVSPWITCRPPPHTRARQRARLSTPPAVSRYGPPLHAAREFGCRNKLFDLLDELDNVFSMADAQTARDYSLHPIAVISFRIL